MVLTFDDSKASHYTVVRPLLKKYGFGATFFITEGFTFRTNKEDYLTWEQIAELHRDGFEIGNHTRDHMGAVEGEPPEVEGAGGGHQRAVRRARHSQARVICLPRQRHRSRRHPRSSRSWGSGLPGAAGRRSIRTRRATASPMNRAAIIRSCSRRRATPVRSGRWRT